MLFAKHQPSLDGDNTQEKKKKKNFRDANDCSYPTSAFHGFYSLPSLEYLRIKWETSWADGWRVVKDSG